MGRHPKRVGRRACQATTQKIHRANQLTALGPLAEPRNPAGLGCVAKHGLRPIASASDPARGCSQAAKPPCPGRDRQTPNRCRSRHTTRPIHLRAQRAVPAVGQPARLVVVRSVGTKKLVQGTGLGSCGLKGFRPRPCAAQCGQWRPANRPHCRSPRVLRPQAAGRWRWFWRGPDPAHWPAANSRVTSPERCH